MAVEALRPLRQIFTRKGSRSSLYDSLEGKKKWIKRKQHETSDGFELIQLKRT